MFFNFSVPGISYVVYLLVLWGCILIGYRGGIKIQSLLLKQNAGEIITFEAQQDQIDEISSFPIPGINNNADFTRSALISLPCSGSGIPNCFPPGTPIISYQKSISQRAPPV